MELRPYQRELVRRAHNAFADGRGRVLLVLPTGSRKTVVFSDIAATVAGRGRSICLLGHRIETVEQISRKLTPEGIVYGIVAPGYARSDSTVLVASIQSLVRRLDHYPSFDVLIADKAHHAVAGSRKRVAEAYPAARILGVTATPERLDGRGLGDVFETIILGPSTAELIRISCLMPATVYAPLKPVDLSHVRARMGDFDQREVAAVMSDARLIGDSGEHYTRHCPGQSAVAFCASVAHPEQVTERFRKARYRALSIDGTTDRDERRAAIVCLGSGRLEVLTACEIVSEGLDIPDIAASILLRPTQSLGLHLQQVGWSLRTASGKARAVILDYAGNTLRHGLPNAHRSWSLDSHKRRAMATAATPVRQCPACFALVAVATLSCTACGEVFEGGQVMLRMAAGKLVEISERARERASLLMRLRALLYREAVLWANGACDRLESVAEARSYKRGWVYHEVQRARDAAISLARTG